MVRFESLWVSVTRQRPSEYLLVVVFVLFFLVFSFTTYDKAISHFYASPPEPIPEFPSNLHLPLRVRPGTDAFLSVQSPLSKILPALAGQKEGLTTRDCKAKMAVEYQYRATQRYGNLSSIANGKHAKTRKYFFALNLYNNAAVLGDIIFQLNEVAAFLGNQNVFISVFENGSKDNTKAMIRVWKKALKALHIEHLLIMDDTPATNAKDNNRIKKLVNVRNRALAPLFDLHAKNKTFDRVIFLNDILFCKDDVLELIFQSYLQHSHVTCGLDWDGPYDGHNPWFYDTWVSRDVNGNAFKKVVGNIIEDDDYSNERLNNNLPFQAHCCWNGMTVLDTSPLYKFNLQFRVAESSSPYNDQCTVISECSLLCKDLFSHGYGRVVIVPRVKVAYNTQVYNLLHNDGGPINEFIPSHDTLFADEESVEISFQDPPDQTYCPSEYFWENVPSVIPDKNGRRRDPLSTEND